MTGLRMAEPVHGQVRRWLMTKPGLFRDVDHGGGLKRALEASDIHCTLDDFKAALKRVGYEPQQRGRAGHYHWVLPLPELQNRCAPNQHSSASETSACCYRVESGQRFQLLMRSLRLFLNPSCGFAVQRQSEVPLSSAA